MVGELSLFETCSVCGDQTYGLGMHVGYGLDDEMVLCEDCAAMAFPGLKEMMRHECPICSGDRNANGKAKSS